MMKKFIKFLVASSFSFITLLNCIPFTASADFSLKNKHWYYSDDQSFKYWGLTDVDSNGIPLDADVQKNITFNGTPQSLYKTGITKYSVTANVYSVPTSIKAQIALRGDADNDNDIDLYDAIFISGTFVGKEKFSSDFHEFSCDYNLDGELTLYDVVEMCKIIMQDSLEVQYTNNKIRDEYVAEVLRLVNVERAKYKLPALVLDDKLCMAAQIRASECAQLDDISHDRPDGSSCFTVLQQLNIAYNYTGENLAAGHKTPAAVVDGWMNSDGHRENILDEHFTKIGIGYCEAPDGVYKYFWSQLFIQD